MQKYVIPLKTSDDKQKCLEIKSKTSVFKKRAVKTWTSTEDQQLLALYHQYPKKWNLISQNMRNRNENQCLHRFRRICQIGQNKKIWSPQEDQTVLKMIKKHGHNWKMIAQTLGSKSGKQIRQRFINKLDPSIRRQEWTQGEDLKIIELYSKLGSKWCEISKNLPGRPQNRIKNRFYSYIQKNYQFKVKQKCMINEQYEDKQNNLTLKLKPYQKIQSVSFTNKQGFLKMLDGNCTNIQQKLNLKEQCLMKDEIKQQMNENQSQQQQKQNQPMRCQSLKEINDECFFECDRQMNNNNDLLYFEDN